jgi:hypothetical protein
MAAFLFPEKIPEVEEKIMAQVQENGAWAYWLLKNCTIYINQDRV